MRWLPLLIFATGCGTVINTTAINPTPHTLYTRPPASVALFTSGPPQGRSYVDVAFLEAEQESGYSVDRMPDFIADLSARAAAMGCDGLVIGSPTNATTVAFDLQTPMNKRGIVATCIVFNDPPSMASVSH
ncbi:hypothetical protein BH11MYX2_BH11MYX2_26290 [soil metagenome]